VHEARDLQESGWASWEWAVVEVSDPDPITTEVIRHGLNSAANQMKRALVSHR
jgi:hypothetical protein